MVSIAIVTEKKACLKIFYFWQSEKCTNGWRIFGTSGSVYLLVVRLGGGQLAWAWQVEVERVKWKHVVRCTLDILSIYLCLIGSCRVRAECLLGALRLSACLLVCLSAGWRQLKVTLQISASPYHPSRRSRKSPKITDDLRASALLKANQVLRNPFLIYLLQVVLRNSSNPPALEADYPTTFPTKIFNIPTLPIHR